MINKQKMDKLIFRETSNLKEHSTFILGLISQKQITNTKMKANLPPFLLVEACDFRSTHYLDLLKLNPRIKKN